MSPIKRQRFQWFRQRVLLSLLTRMNERIGLVMSGSNRWSHLVYVGKTDEDIPMKKSNSSADMRNYIHEKRVR